MLQKIPHTKISHSVQYSEKVAFFGWVAPLLQSPCIRRVSLEETDHRLSPYSATIGEIRHYMMSVEINAIDGAPKFDFPQIMPKLGTNICSLNQITP